MIVVVVAVLLLRARLVSLFVVDIYFQLRFKDDRGRGIQLNLN